MKFGGPYDFPIFKKPFLKKMGTLFRKNTFFALFYLFSR